MAVLHGSETHVDIPFQHIRSHDSSSTNSANCVSLVACSEPLQLACKEVWSRGLQRWHRVCGAMTLDADSDRLIIVGGSTRGRGE